MLSQFKYVFLSFTSSMQFGIKGKAKSVIINKAETLEDFLAVLSHEVLHSVFHIMKNVSIEYTDKSEEAFTYLMEHITKEIVHGIEQE